MTFSGTLLKEVKLMALRAAMEKTMVLFTDGVTEAVDPAGNFYGGDQLRGTIRELAGSTAQNICQDIYERVDSYRGGLPAQDDLTVLALQRG